MTYTTIDKLSNFQGMEVGLKGWLYNKRGSRSLAFLIVRDGTGMVQCVVNKEVVTEETWNIASELTQESALEINGSVHADDRQIGGLEIEVSDLKLISKAEEYPISPKAHGVEFLMNHRHLWLRSKRQWAIMRIRNSVIMSIHQYFQENGFIQMDAPILTGNAVEGTSTLFGIDYFDRDAYLTQSGQLYGEAMAMAFGKIYTFGPTFRAEKSKTRRHLTEFWMIEPEMAFFDLSMDMDLAEGLIQRVVKDVLNNCRVELEAIGRSLEPLQCVEKQFPRLSYTEAVDLLKSDETAKLLEEKIEAVSVEENSLKEELSINRKRHGQAKKGEKRRIDARNISINKRLSELEEDKRNLPKWKASVENFTWGSDFGGSDETVLTWHFDRPIMVHRYPAAVKAFYMKRDPEDDRLALGVDVLAPEGYGEIIGGGERATDLEFLKRQVKEHDLPSDVFSWYFDLRRYGSVPHSGFGLGLERTVTWICGLHHLREAIPFPRTMDRLSP